MAVTTREVLANQAAVQAPALANKSLISEQAWHRVVNRIVKDEKLEHSLAERIVDQALGFLRLCALEPTGHYSPSPMVDIGWHTLLMYTRIYAALCDRLGGRFIHHEPSDVPGMVYPSGNVGRTVEAMQAHGIHVDGQLWLKAKAECRPDPLCSPNGCGPCDAGVTSAAPTNQSDCSSYCSGDSCSGGGGDGDPGCSH